MFVLLNADESVLAACRDINATGRAARLDAIWERICTDRKIPPRSAGAHWTAAERDLYAAIGKSTQALKARGQLFLRKGPGYGWVHPEFPYLLTEGVPVSQPQHVITGRSVPLKDLWLEAPPHWVNPREFTGLDDGELNELGQSIKAKGIVDPLKVQKILVNGEVRDLVIDGQRRVMAAREVLAKGAPIPVVDLSEDARELTPDFADELLMKALTTLEREDLSSYEISTVAERMHKRGKTLKQISDKIGKSESWISRMLKARGTATPKLMLQWRKGEVTDEQFKDLAAEKDPEKQVEKTQEVVQTRKSGDKAEARVKAKEVAETARASSKPAKTSTKPAESAPPEVPAAVGGEQQEMFNGGKAPSKAPPASATKAEDKPKMRSRAVLDDLLHTADKKPPTSDIVKGIVMGVKYAAGLLEAHEFGKAWDQYMARVTGQPVPGKKPAKAKAAKKPAKKPAKAKAAKKPAKKPAKAKK